MTLSYVAVGAAPVVLVHLGVMKDVELPESMRRSMAVLRVRRNHVLM